MPGGDLIDKNYAPNKKLPEFSMEMDVSHNPHFETICFSVWKTSPGVDFQKKWKPIITEYHLPKWYQKKRKLPQIQHNLFINLGKKLLSFVANISENGSVLSQRCWYHSLLAWALAKGFHEVITTSQKQGRKVIKHGKSIQTHPYICIKSYPLPPQKKNQEISWPLIWMITLPKTNSKFAPENRPKPKR